MASTPLRTHVSGRQQPTISSAASAHLRHLQQVASWASLLVPPLGALLGSRLASTSEIIGCPPPSFPHFTCQRCESIFHAGLNCSVRVKTRKSKRRGTVTRGVSAPVNNFIYFCQHCAFESVISGTSKAYVKTKLSEAAARQKLSEPYQSLDVCIAEKGTQLIKGSSNEILSSPQFSTESPCSTSKRTKRKGWLSLKQLSASSSDLSPADSRPTLSMRSAKSPLMPQFRRLDSTRVMATVSQADPICLRPTSDIVGEICIKTMSELEPSEGDIGSKKVVSCKLDLSDSLGVVAISSWSDAEVIIPVSRNVGRLNCLEKLPASTTDVLQQSNAAKIIVNANERGLQQKLSNQHTNADAAMLEQFTALASVLKCPVQNTLSTHEAHCNLSCAALQNDSAIVAPISSLQGLSTNDDVTVNLDSAKSVEDAGLPLMVKSSIDHFDDSASNFSLNDKVITNNSCIAEAVWLKKRKRYHDNNWCTIPRKQEDCKPEADKLRLHELDIKQTDSVMVAGLSGLTCKNTNTQTLAHERTVKPRKKKPLFRRVGRHWFTICKLSRTLKWRII